MAKSAVKMVRKDMQFVGPAGQRRHLRDGLWTGLREIARKGNDLRRKREDGVRPARWGRHEESED